MSFPFNFYSLALLGSFLVAFLSLPLWARWCVRTGHVDDPGHRKIHDQPIPLAGGLAVFTGLALPVLIGALAICFGAGNAALTHGLGRRALELSAIVFGALAMTILGVLDDKHELRPAVKFTGQFLIASLVAAAGVRITLFVHNPLFSFAVTVLWLLTLINALNFMDNMNGLCAGLGAIAGWCFAVLAAASGQYLVALIALIVVGSLVGYLPHNFPKARAFLGDAGSHLVGYLLAVLAILPHFYTPGKPRRLAVLTPLLVLALPLFDLGCVVIIRTLNRKPFYIGDTNHLSHRLVRRGLSKTTAVLLIWLLAAVSGSLAVWLNL
jgi:UDP-GlcNAc:undecaprenyl-phosphate/decaprenyl-phosphate GlcNAc-1-phosphate transferase